MNSLWITDSGCGLELYSGGKLSEGAPHGIFDARGLEYLYTSGSICPPPARLLIY